MVPYWLHLVSLISLGVGAVCAVWIALDERARPQKMGIMNLVWPVVALFGSVFALWGYFRYGRTGAGDHPFDVSVGIATSHCGAGCTLGDLCAEWLAFLVPTILPLLGWHTLFAEKIFAVWVLDYIFAFGFGIAFQYFTIAPMQNLGLGEGLGAAIKADALSLTAWQFGMYGFMAFAQFYLFRHVLHARIDVRDPEFWFAMQVAMLCGFGTSYPANLLLIRAGIKEEM